MHPCLDQATRYESLESFYQQNTERRYSGEAEYGCHWTLLNENDSVMTAPRWRVSYVRNTGEVYAVVLSRQEAPLYVLAVVPPDDVDYNDFRRPYYGTLEKILDGWAERCAKPNSLPWVVETFQAWTKRQAFTGA